MFQIIIPPGFVIRISSTNALGEIKPWKLCKVRFHSHLSNIFFFMEYDSYSACSDGWTMNKSTILLKWDCNVALGLENIPGKNQHSRVEHRKCRLEFLLVFQGLWMLWKPFWIFLEPPPLGDSPEMDPAHLPCCNLPLSALSPPHLCRRQRPKSGMMKQFIWVSSSPTISNLHFRRQTQFYKLLCQCFNLHIHFLSNVMQC